MSVAVITKDNFESEVLASEIPVIVDFFAEWCAPCRMLAPELAEFAAANTGKVKVCKVNVDESPEIAKNYSILSTPTILVFSHGEIVEENVGLIRKDEIAKLLKLK